MEFLDSGFKEAVEEYRKKFTNASTAEETLFFKKNFLNNFF